jgi:hypothetical protein
MTTIPVLNQLNIVAKDFDATLSFYRRLGLRIPDPASHDGIRHAEINLPNGFTLEFDNHALARTYNAAWRRPEGSSATLIGFALPSTNSTPSSSRQVTRLANHLTTRSGEQGMRLLRTPMETAWGS